MVGFKTRTWFDSKPVLSVSLSDDNNLHTDDIVLPDLPRTILGGFPSPVFWKGTWKRTSLGLYQVEDLLSHILLVGIRGRIPSGCCKSRNVSEGDIVHIKIIRYAFRSSGHCCYLQLIPMFSLFVRSFALSMRRDMTVLLPPCSDTPPLSIFFSVCLHRNEGIR